MPFVVPPVLLLAWRRPTLTQQVVTALRATRPPDVFVSLDGPSGTFPGDPALIDRTRKVIEDGVDWPCDIRWRFGPAGASASRAVADGIDWFFAHDDLLTGVGQEYEAP